MANKFINYFSNVLKYNEKEVYIALHDKTNESYFHANQLCKLLEYVEFNQYKKANNIIIRLLILSLS